jgi:tRNA dimethylallyltransferase
MDFAEITDCTKERSALQEYAEKEGNLALYHRLEALDPVAATRIHPNNVKRVIRAIEVATNASSGIKDFKNDLKPNLRYDFYLMGLTGDRSKLYDRINRRVLAMFDQGLIEELNFLKNLGLDDSFTSMKGIGYKEIFPYLQGLKTLDQVIQEIQQNSRHYAKRQLTWFKRYPNLTWYDVDAWQDLNTLIEIIEKEIRAHYNI